ncbi:MAG: AroM family protein [Stellaceae bacterium]
MPRTLGIAVIGQSPRPEIAALYAAAMPPDTRIVLRGCFDGLSEAEIDARAPVSAADALYTPLPIGREVKISKRAVAERAPMTLAALRHEGADAIVFNCTGEFPPMAGDTGVLFPSRVLNGLAAALLPRGRLGLLIPIPEQAEILSEQRGRPGVEVVVEVLKPSADSAAVADAAQRLAAKQPDLVAMDCMSYTPATKAIVHRAISAPILLAVTATSRVLRELLD